MLTEAKNDIKKTWQVLHPLIGKQQRKEPILNEFIIEDKIVANSEEILNSFSKFFANVGKNLQNKIPKPNKSYESYLSPDSPQNSVFLYPVAECELQDVLSAICNKKERRHRWY